MPNYCKLELSGHIGRIAPKERYTDFSVAWNPGKKDDNKPAIWFQCRAVGNAHLVLQEMTKGAGVVITKSIPEIWKDKNGNERWSWVVFEAEKYQKKEQAQETPYDDDSIPF